MNKSFNILGKTFILKRCKKEEDKKEDFFKFNIDKNTAYKIIFFVGTMFFYKSKFKVFSIIIGKYSFSFSNMKKYKENENSKKSFHTFDDNGNKKTKISYFTIFGKYI